MENDRILTVDEVADRLGLHGKYRTETVKRYLRSGKLRGLLRARKLGWEIRASDVDAYLASQWARADVRRTQQKTAVDHETANGKEG